MDTSSNPSRHPASQGPRSQRSDALDAHGAFLRRLARSLVRDEQRAEDIVQEAYVAVLQRPPPERAPLRAWLAGIVKNIARRSQRGEARRRTRETKAASGSAPVPPPDDITVRLELQQRLTEAVRLLEEPTRTTVVQRFYDGLTPTRIAEMEGVSVRTIESRLRRAREQLRHVLDRASGGDRGRWMLAFAPMAFEPEALTALFAGAQAGQAAGTAAGSGVAASAPAASVVTTMAVLGLGGVAAIGFWLGTRDTPSPAPEASAPVVAQAPSAADPVETDAARRLRELQAELERARAERRALEQARKAGPTTRPADAPKLSPAYVKAVRTPTFLPPSGAPELEAVSWAESGQALVHLNAALDRMAAHARDSSAGDFARIVADVQLWNSPLMTLEAQLQARGLGGDPIGNQGFTAPYPQANLIHAALLYAGHPLTKAQRASLGELAAKHARSEAVVLASTPRNAIRLRRVLRLAALRQAFFDEVVPVLTRTQRDILQPPSVRGRAGFDLLSDASIWQMQAETMAYTDDAQLERMVGLQLSSALGLEEPARRALLEDEVRRWIQHDLTDARILAQDALHRFDAFQLAPLRAAAEASARLFERLIDRLPPAHPAVRKLRDHAKAILPIHKPHGR